MGTERRLIRRAARILGVRLQAAAGIGTQSGHIIEITLSAAR